MEVLLTYKESNIEVKIEEGEDSLSKLRQALLIALNSHPGCSVADHSAATERCQFQRWSERWDCYVNIASSDDVRANDKIVPLFKSETSPQELGKKGSTLCNSLKKPGEADAKVLKELFSSSSSSQKRSSSNVFDPAAECVALSAKRKKKRAIRNRTTKVTVLMVEPSRGVPKGKQRRKLRDEGFEEILEIKRNMYPVNVQSAIAGAFGTIDYKLLSVKDGRFVRSSNQKPSGDEVVEIITKRKCPMYICCNVDSDDELPPATMLRKDSSTANANDTTAKVIDITDTDEEYSSTPSVSVVPEKNRSDNESERRQIREEQDLAYEEMLQADRRRDLERSDEAKKKMKLDDLKIKYQAKFLERNGSMFITFRLPDGTRLQKAFMPDDKPKVLYEYVFSSGVCQPFIILKKPPSDDIDPNCPQNITSLASSVLTIKIDDAAPDLESYLSDPCVQEEARHLESFDCDLDSKAVLDAADYKRREFVISKRMKQQGLPHTIDRKNVFQDVMGLFAQDEVLEEYPLRIKFAGELGYDCGGVCRDMFSAYWDEAYQLFFDGSTSLVPALHLNINMSAFPCIGRVLSHGYILCGFLPTRIAFPVLASILLGSSVEIPNNILVKSFAESLSCFEANIVKEALSSSDGEFTAKMKGKLISVLSRYNCRVCPTPQTLQSQLVDLAKLEFQAKPMAAVCNISNGIPPNEKPFWHSYSVKEFYSLYLSLDATPEKVLAILEEPKLDNECQARVFTYLQQLIGNMKNNELRRFLRFVTGSSVLLPGEISVSFNGSSSYPLGRTCSCLLELSAKYTSYLDFEREMYAVLSDDEHNWQMNMI